MTYQLGTSPVNYIIQSVKRWSCGFSLSSPHCIILSSKRHRVHVFLATSPWHHSTQYTDNFQRNNFKQMLHKDSDINPASIWDEKQKLLCSLKAIVLLWNYVTHITVIMINSDKWLMITIFYTCCYKDATEQCITQQFQKGTCVSTVNQ